MPEIIPLGQHATVTPTTTPPSVKLQEQLQASEQSPPNVEAPAPAGELAKDPEAEKFEKFSRLEKKLLYERKKLEEQRKAVEEKEARLKPYEEAQSLASQRQALKAIEKLGITYDDLTNLVLNQGNLTPEQIAEQKAESIVTQRINELQKQQAEAAEKAQAEQYQRALQQITQEAQNLAAQSQDFPLVKHMEAYDTVTALIEQTFHQTSRIMPVEEAMKEVENYLEENTLQVAKLDKIKNKLFPAQEEPQKQAPVAPAQSQQPKTLTHRVATAPTPAAKNLTAEEKRQRAIDIFYGRVTP